MKKMSFVLTIVVAAVMLLSACGPAATTAAPVAPATQAPAAPVLLPTATMAPAATAAPATAAPATTAPDCTQATVFCVGDVTDVGHVDDKSFNQSTWEGVQNAKKDGDADWIQYH